MYFSFFFFFFFLLLTKQTIQELFEVHSPMEDSGFRVKAEEFVVLSQEPSPAENISPKVARPFIEVIINIYIKSTAVQH